jgi:hypothetical protein
VTAANERRYDTDVELRAADLSPDDLHDRPRRGRDEIRSVANLVNLGNYDIFDRIRGLAIEGAAIAKRVGSSWASRRRVTT